MMERGEDNTGSGATDDFHASKAGWEFWRLLRFGMEEAALPHFGMRT